MKRSEMLTSLSHDHHQALRASQLLKRCDESDAVDVRDGFRGFWEPHVDHIRIEEEILFPKYAEFRGDDDPLLVQARDEHQRISALADAVLNTDPPPVEKMHQLGEVLHDHTRFEEREFFGVIEETIPVDQQPALMEALDHPDPGPDWQPPRND